MCVVEKIKLTEEEQILTGRTEVAKEFSKLHFDKSLQPNNVASLETYIMYNKKQIEGFDIKKHHADEPTAKLYFLRAEHIRNLPLIPLKTTKIHDARKVYYLITQYEELKIPKMQIYTWKELVDYSGMPNSTHSNKLHYILYKNKMLYSRLKPQVYSRVITESAFGKTKYLEWIRQMINNMSMLSDPSPPKLFYSACHMRYIVVNEMPDTINKTNFIKSCNMFMNIGEGATTVDNPSRATKGTFETADTSQTSVTFTHNIPKYYKDTGSPTFEEIYPYNVINRYYYNLYDGFLAPKFPKEKKYKTWAKKFEKFFQMMTSTMLWFEEHWDEMDNNYPYVSLDKYHFKDNENRFKDHFIDFAKCLSHYAENEELYKLLLDEEYKTHQNYRRLIYPDNTYVKPEELFVNNG